MHHRNDTKITFATLDQWKKDKLFDLEPDLEFDREKEFVTKYRYPWMHEYLNTHELLAIFCFFHIFRDDSKEYQQVMEALNDAFAGYGNKAWMNTILDATRIETTHQNLTIELLKNQAKTIFWIMDRFEIMASSYIITEIKQYHEVMDLLLCFSRMEPRKSIEYTIDSLLGVNFKKEPSSRTISLISKIRQTDFQRTFLSFLLPDKEIFLEKIFSSPRKTSYAIQLVSCYKVLEDIARSSWTNNLFNMKLLWNHPEKASDLYSIFTKFDKNTKRYLQLTENLYQKIMHPSVLNNLSLVKKQIFVFNDINIVDGIISWNFIYQIYPCLSAWLPKDMVTEILFKLILLTKNTFSSRELVLTLNTHEKRISFPLIDSMVQLLDEDDVMDIKLALRYINLETSDIFNQLSPRSLQSLLNKLGQDFVQNFLFSQDTSGRMYDILGKMSLDCQKEFLTFIAYDQLKAHFTDTNKSGWLIMENLVKEAFIFLLDRLGSLEYITEIVLKSTRSKSASEQRGKNWSVNYCYQFLGKIERCSQMLLNESLEKLGRQWLFETNHDAESLSENLTCLTTHSQMAIIQQIDSVDVQKIFKTFEELACIFKFESPEIRATLLKRCGNAHIKELAQNTNASNALTVLDHVLYNTTDNTTASQTLDALHINVQLLLKIFPTPSYLVRYDDSKTILIVEKMRPVYEKWLNEHNLSALFINLPVTYYSTFFAHQPSIALVNWEFLTRISFLIRPAILKALPDAFFEKNPIGLEQLKHIDSGNDLVLCIEKTPEKPLKDLLNHPHFIRSVYGIEKEIFSCLLKKLGIDYLKTKPEIYREIAKYLPLLEENTQQDTGNHGFFSPGESSDSVERSDQYRPK